MRVCVIEDNEFHRKQILNVVESRGDYGYQINFRELADRRSYSIGGCDVVVVDLQLDPADFKPEQGVALVEEQLWPVDREMWFVVFSSNIYGGNIDEDMWRRTEPRPKVVLVQKTLDESAISKSSLNALYENALEKIRPLIKATRIPIRTDSSSMVHDISRFGELLRNAQRPLPIHFFINLDRFVGRLIRSNQIIRALIDRLDGLSRMGKVSDGVSAVVYGSHGRRDSREGSDVEFHMIMHTEDANESDSTFSPFDIGAIAWNMCCRCCIDLGEEPEGAKYYVITPAQLSKGGGAEKNEYAPGILRKEMVYILKEGKFQQARNKLVQLMTESVPVYNRELYVETLVECIQALVDNPTMTSLVSLMSQPRVQQCFRQYEIDTARMSVNYPKEKHVINRYFSMWTFQLSLIHSSMNAEKNVTFREYFNSHSRPPMLRVIGLYAALDKNELGDVALTSKEQLMRLLADSVAQILEIRETLISDEDQDQKPSRQIAEFAQTVYEIMKLLRSIHPRIAEKWFAQVPGDFGIQELRWAGS